jgi:RNA polymerase sigma factor (sigma-70 family)
MTHDTNSDSSPDRDPWRDRVEAHLAGDRAGSEALASALDPALRPAVLGLLGPDDRDVDDVVSESIVAVLEYLTRRGEFQGSFLVFAVTVARNRCRNLLVWRRRRPQVPLEPLTEWIAHPERTALDALVERERRDMLQETLARLGTNCAQILRWFDLENVSMEEIRRRLGLRTVQGAYYRRAQCLKKAFEHLNNRLSDCSTHDGSPLANESPRGSEPHE